MMVSMQFRQLVLCNKLCKPLWELSLRNSAPIRPISGKYDDKEEAGTSVHHKKNNVLPLWGNERSMNLNPLILTNIQSSHYFKGNSHFTLQSSLIVRLYIFDR